MDLEETLNPGVATVISTGVKNLLHRMSKVEEYASMAVITRYLKETYSDAFNHIHALNHIASTTQLVDAIWGPLGSAADANTYGQVTKTDLASAIRVSFSWGPKFTYILDSTVFGTVV